jgi:mannose/fructose-specific phosphotransferase system component IIA
MNKNYLNLVITHGDLAETLIRVVEKLVTPATPFWAFSNQELSSEELAKAIQLKIDEIQPERIVIFVDLVGGSCWTIGNRLKQTVTNLTVIGGVNVPMLVSYHINFNRLDDELLFQKIIQDAQKGILSR